MRYVIAISVMGRASLRLLLRRAVLFALVTTTAMAYHSFASRDLMQGTLPERRESTDESSLDAIIRVRRCTSGGNIRNARFSIPNLIEILTLVCVVCVFACSLPLLRVLARSPRPLPPSALEAKQH